MKRTRKKQSASQPQSTLYLKFSIIYIIFGFLCVFIIATLTSGLTYSSLKKSTSRSLYQSANLVSMQYLSGYFTEEVSYSSVQAQLHGMKSYMDASVWFVDQEGTMIASAKPDSYPLAPAAIQDFNPAEAGNATYLEGTYHDYFQEEVLTIIAPVTQGFVTKGYVLIHKETSDIQEILDGIMINIYLTMLIIYFLSFSILLAFQLLVFLPLRKITEAATQYASGNLDYVIPVRTEDEMGYLSASLNYMSSHLQDMKDYQKNFVANVSHDFRSPLTSIKGYVEAIADGTIPPEFQEKYLKIILLETERLTDLTQDLLTLNEFDTEHLLLTKTVFDVHEMIKNTAASFEGTCTQKKISIELLFATKVLKIYADKRKVQQILYNLIDNAIKFSDADSMITVETTERGEKVYISVKDYGCGIPRDSIGKIWERFYKTDASRGKDKKGTGLGLAIVKEAIQAHEEHINVISTEGVGTEFIFSMPRIPK